VTSWADAHRRGAAKAAEVQADLNIRLDRPVDVFSAVERLGLVLAFAPLGKVSGIYLPRLRSPGILIHSGHPRTRQRYTAAHELGHHVFGHAAEVDMDLELQLQRGEVERWPDHEKEAEAFAAWFLMPRRLLREGMRQLGMDRPRSPYDVYTLALWLGTSYAATLWQLDATRLLPPRQAATWARISPREIKQSLAGDLPPANMSNDVWLLGAHHNRQPVEVRPGDRLVLVLDEIPSSGYSWRLTELPAGFRVLADSNYDDWEPRFGVNAIEDDDLAGTSHPHFIVIELDPQLPESIQRLALVKDQEWNHAMPSDDFEILVSIRPPLSGIQLSEQELALSA
jgi:Zn-dependent peptidase ImmA (M78 family)